MLPRVYTQNWSDFQKNPLSTIQLIKSGQIGVIPTDTIYGLVASALNKSSVENLYRLRRRTPTKPCIVLISSLDDLKKFDIRLTDTHHQFLSKHWPNPLSVVLPASNPKWHYLHRGTNSLAFRLPNNPNLINLISQTGPIVAPSANFEGQPPATTITEAKNYFSDQVAFYIDSGELKSEPSTLITFDNNQPKILRQGAFKIDLPT